MSKITVTTIAGQTSGADANKVKIESGDTLEVVSNATVGGTLGVTGATTLNGNIVLDNEDTTLSGGEVLGKIEFKDNDGGSAAAGITSKMESLAIGDFGASALTFHTSTSGGGARTALTERMRVQHNGGITFNGDTADANALDDYEEGTWTPVISGATVSAGTLEGAYTKVGDLVTATFRLNAATLAISGGAPDTITGLPFTSQMRTTSSKPATYNHQHGDKTLTVLLEGGTTTLYQQYSTTGAWQTAPISAGTGRYMHFQITYLSQ